MPGADQRHDGELGPEVGDDQVELDGAGGAGRAPSAAAAASSAGWVAAARSSPPIGLDSSAW